MSSGKPMIVLLGTCDTKLDELLFTKRQLQALVRADITIQLVDVGRDPVSNSEIDVSPPSQARNANADRNDIIAAMSSFATRHLQTLHAAGRVCGVIGNGGSGGTSIAASAMRAALPIGMPKLIVSTMASGDVSSFVGEVDIAMMYSVVDVAGLNPILCSILSNAAHAIAGMAKGFLSTTAGPRPSAMTPDSSSSKPAVAITMFGITTPAATAIRLHLESHSCTTYTFHATGSGGRALERLILEGRIDAVVDLTTTELADHLFGGVLSAGPDRLTAASRKGIPQVISLGALDSVNFGPRDTVPEKYSHRRLLEHNPSVTLLRTNADECRQLGKEICKKLTETATERRLVEVYIPLRGVSMISVEGGPFHDRDADEALLGAVQDGLEGTGIKVVTADADINDKSFAVSLAVRILEMLKVGDRRSKQEDRE